MITQFEIPDEILQSIISAKVLSGGIDELIAAQIANVYASIKTVNRTEAAKLCNISRTTLYQHENEGLVTFRKDGKITLASLVEFQKNFPVETKNSEPETVKTIARRPNKPRRRTLKAVA